LRTADRPSFHQAQVRLEHLFERDIHRGGYVFKLLKIQAPLRRFVFRYERLRLPESLGDFGLTQAFRDAKLRQYLSEDHAALLFVHAVKVPLRQRLSEIRIYARFNR